VSTPENRRESERKSHHAVHSLQILFASETPGLLGNRLAGETIDVSTSGLGLILDQDVPVGCTLDVRVTLKDDPKRYSLSGKVRWCKPAEEKGKFAVGVALHERTDIETDLEAWKKTLSE